MIYASVMPSVLIREGMHYIRLLIITIQVWSEESEATPTTRYDTPAHPQ